MPPSGEQMKREVESETRLDQPRSVISHAAFP